MQILMYIYMDLDVYTQILMYISLSCHINNDLAVLSLLTSIGLLWKKNSFSLLGCQFSLTSNAPFQSISAAYVRRQK